MASRRALRSANTTIDLTGDSEPETEPQVSTSKCVSLTPSDQASTIRLIPYGSTLPNISKADLKLLRQKQDRLKATKSAIEGTLPSKPSLHNALSSTLIFAHYEAGTAVCINTSGRILTCAHCFGDSEDEFRKNKNKWLLFYTGQAVLVRCETWDPKRDLALAQVIAVECDIGYSGLSPVFASIGLSLQPPPARANIICIGQPGRDDLESTSARKTTYNLVEVSNGNLRGYIEGVDPQDNSDIGVLKHDAWTYWGHSGAPLVKRNDGTLVGMHSSWDDQTAMRHGIPWVAVREFLRENGL